MLVLRRKAGESIVLNGTITIQVLAVEGERVKLGITAPPDVLIVRSELLGNSPLLAAGSGSRWPNRENREPAPPSRMRGVSDPTRRAPLDPRDAALVDDAELDPQPDVERREHDGPTSSAPLYSGLLGDS